MGKQGIPAHHRIGHPRVCRMGVSTRRVMEFRLGMDRRGHLGGAFEPSVDPDLLTAPNCTLLPHIASATRETRTAIGQLAANAIAGILNQKDLDDIPNLIPDS